MDYSVKSIESTLLELGTSVEGLSRAEADLRSKKYAQNVLQKPKRSSLVKKFFMQLSDLMILILLAAAAVSFIIGIIQKTTSEIIDGAVILAIVIMNAIFGMLQENKAEKSLEALEKMTQPEAILKRDGLICREKTSSIVPGDIIMLEAGSVVPADCRLIESNSLLIDESSLTGESHPVEKDANFKCIASSNISEKKNMVFNGTTVVQGRAIAVAVGVGKDSEFGKIASVITMTQKEMTPLQNSIKDLGKVITFLVLGMAVVTFIIELIARFNPMEAFLTAVAISVAAIPESMPAVITIIMSLGIARLAKNRAIVRHMHSVETLGCCDIICSDKTGTITQNKMSVVSVYCGCRFGENKNSDFEQLLLAMTLCLQVESSKNGFSGAPTELAIAEFAKKFGYERKKSEASYPRVSEIPFSSSRKLMSTINKFPQSCTAFVKGAVDRILDKCDFVLVGGKVMPLTEQRRKQILAANLKFASQALRVIGFATKNDVNISGFKEEGLTFIGLVGMMDKPRPEVAEAVKKCKSAGMRPIMITGDHMETAFAVAKEIGIAKKKSEVISGEEIDNMTNDEFDAAIKKVSVFARVSPQHKVQIVEAFKRQGHVVAMTGDGVNDAASMKKASIGIGMGINGTDVTKEVADIIITDDNFATIVMAVEEGRVVYKNIQKTVKFLFSANMGEILALFLATIFFPQYQFLLPIQILFVNLITDSLPAIALGLEPAESNLMDCSPRPKNENIFSGGNGAMTIIMGLVQTLLTVAAFCIGLYVFGEPTAMSMAFYTLNIVQFFYLLSLRTEAGLLRSNPFKNKYCILAVGFAAGILTLIAATPLHRVLKLSSLNLWQWLTIMVLGLIMMLCSEVCKYFIRKRQKSGKK